MGLPTSSRLGFGLMNFTWKPKQTPDEQAFAAIKAAVDSGITILNGGDFYGQGDQFLNLKLLARFFDAYPDYVDRVYLEIKGAVGSHGVEPDASEENLRMVLERDNKMLGGKKTIDLFQMARVDQKVDIEVAVQRLAKLRDEGLFKDIGLSECSAATIRRAASVTTIAAVEVEYSPFTIDIERNGVLETCKELGIPVVGYSPLGRGIIDPKIRKASDIPEGDNRRNFPRFQEGNIEKYVAIVDKIREIANKKQCTTAQIVLAWLLAQSDIVIPIPGSTRPEGVAEFAGALKVKLSHEELDQVRQLAIEADKHALARYPAKGVPLTWG